MSENDYSRDGWRPSWRASGPPALPTEYLAKLPDRDDRAADTAPLVFGPVETATGNEVRTEGIRVLGTKVERLRETVRHRRLTGLETRDLQDAESAIQTLRKMAPVGELLEAQPGRLD